MKSKYIVVSLIIVIVTIYGCKDNPSESARWQKIGELSFPDGDVWEPSGIAIGPKDSIVVADLSPYCQVHLFNDEGLLLGSLGEVGKDPGQLFVPVDISVDGNGIVYVAETETRRVTKFNNDGTLLDVIEPEGALICYAVAASTSGEIYIIDTLGDELYIFSEDGSEIARWGKRLGLLKPEDVAVYDKKIAIVDNGNDRTIVCDMQGDIVNELTVDNDPTFEPHEVAFGPDGSVFVLGLSLTDGELLEGYIAHFGEDGEFIEKINIASQKPTSLAVNSEGTLYVGDGSMHTVEIYRFE